MTSSPQGAGGAQRKTYVLDTSVLLSAPRAMSQFGEHEVVLPLVVIKELESKRHDPSLGFAAREALRALEELRARGDIRAGVPVGDEGGTVRIEINHVDQSGLPDALRRDTSHDTRILAVANSLSVEGNDVVVVSKDMPMRIQADALGLGAERYRNELVVVEKPYTGMTEANVGTDLVADLFEHREVRFSDLEHRHVPQPGGQDVVDEIVSLPSHTCVKLIGPSSSCLAVVTVDKSLRLITGDRDVFGVTGRSAEQRVALDHLMNPDVGVVSLGGLAGAGKTYLALAAGLDQVLESSTYNKVLVFRPLYAVGGQELGYLPGSAEEKMAPWAAAVFDALESMVAPEVVDEVKARNLLEVQPLTHIRGRSLSDTFVIIDEAQNLERGVLLTALSRLGEGSKVALCWDAAQRDNLHVGRYDGIAAVVERLKGEHLFAHVTMTKSERGPVAAMVANLLDELVA